MLDKIPKKWLVLGFLAVLILTCFSAVAASKWFTIGWYNQYGRAPLAYYTGYYPGDSIDGKVSRLLVDEYISPPIYKEDTAEFADKYNFTLSVSYERASYTFICLSGGPCRLFSVLTH